MHVKIMKKNASPYIAECVCCRFTALTKLLPAGLLVYSYVMTSKLIGPQVLNGIRTCNSLLFLSASHAHQR